MWVSTAFTTEPAESTEIFSFIFFVDSVLSVVNLLLAHPIRHSIFTVDSILVLFEGTMTGNSWHSDIPARKEKGS